LEFKIEETLKELNMMTPLSMPIVHIEGSQYLIGIKILNLELAGDNINIRVGGGYNSLKNYLKNNCKIT
jgi:hypothetical protein